MATATQSVTSVAMEMAKPLLNAYEDFTIQGFVPGVNGYVLTLRTNLMVHVKHTRKNVFKPHSVYQATSMTAVPNKPFIEAWLKNARQAATEHINKGDYTDEKLVAGEWQSWKRKFNQWIYYDRTRNMLFGKVHAIGARSADLQRTNTAAPSELATKATPTRDKEQETK